MIGNLSIPGRLQLAGYAGLANGFRRRLHPVAVIAGVDVVAVALAFGALDITGAMMGGGNPLIAATAPRESLQHPMSVALAMPPRPALVNAALAAALPNTEILFGAPAIALGTFGDSTATFTPPPERVAMVDPAPPANDSGEDAASPPPEKIAGIAMTGRASKIVARATEPAIDNADGSLDQLLLRGIPAASANLAGTVSVGAGGGIGEGPVSAGAAANTTLAANVSVSTASVQPIVAPVTHVVSTVVGLLN